MLIILSNACIGIVITMVYKYGDAIIKTFASSFATALLIYISSIWFGLSITPTVVMGSVIVACVSYIYSADATRIDVLLADAKKEGRREAEAESRGAAAGVNAASASPVVRA